MVQANKFRWAESTLTRCPVHMRMYMNCQLGAFSRPSRSGSGSDRIASPPTDGSAAGRCPVSVNKTKRDEEGFGRIPNTLELSLGVLVGRGEVPVNLIQCRIDDYIPRSSFSWEWNELSCSVRQVLLQGPISKPQCSYHGPRHAYHYR